MKLSFLPLFLLFFANSFAQKSASLQQYDKLVRFNFTSLLDPLETNLSLGFEYRLKNNTAVSLDVGYVFISNTFNDNTLKANGIVVRPAFRLYTGERKRFYIETEAHLKSVTTTIRDWISRGVENNVPNYQEFTNFRIRKNVMGANFKIGYQARLSKDNKFWMEPYFGIGVKLRRTFLYKEPNSSYNFIEGFFNNNEQAADRRIALPNVAFGTRFLIKI